MGGISVWDAKSKVAQEVCKDWLEVCSRDYGKLLLDSGIMGGNLKLIAHRHDQPLFSLAVKTRKIPPILDCTYYPEPSTGKEALSVPILQTRHKGILSLFWIEKFEWAKMLHCFDLAVFKIERHLLSFSRFTHLRVQRNLFK